MVKEGGRRMKKVQIIYRGIDDGSEALYHITTFDADKVDIRIIDTCLIVWDSETGKLKFMTPLHRVVCCEEIESEVEE